MCLSIFFFNDTATTEIYTYLHTLSLHDALPIYPAAGADLGQARRHEQSEAFADHSRRREEFADRAPVGSLIRSEEHTSELQSLMRNSYAVFCLKKKTQIIHNKST